MLWSVPDPTTPEELPPLDDNDDDESEQLRDEELGELFPSDNESSHGPEEELPTDPYVVLELGEDLSEPDSEAPVLLDFGTELIDPLDEERDVEVEDKSPFDTSDDHEFTEGDDARAEPEGEAGIEDHSAVDEAAFPDLDADDQGFTADEALFGALPDFAPEAVLPRAERSWRVDFVSEQRERCSALVAAGGTVVAGSSDLLWFDAGRETPVRVSLDGTRITSLALVGEERKVALCVTAFGRLVRRARSASDSERLLDWKRAAEAGGASAESLELRQLGEATPRAVLGRLTSGHLIRSEDQGSTWQRQSEDFTAFSLSPSGEPLAALSRAGSLLSISRDGGLTFLERELTSPALTVSAGDAPVVAASGSTLAIADAERGVVVSADEGATFYAVAGCANATAVTAGAIGGAAAVVVALYREAEDVSDLVLIDPANGQAKVIATLSSRERDPDQIPEGGRVERLAWDGTRLWAAGGFGVAIVRPE
jgi:hypothetical protein